MNWDLTFSQFKIYGPDHPENIDFDNTFPNGAFIAFLPVLSLPQTINAGRVFLDKDEILKNVSGAKWERLKVHVSNDGKLSPPWGLLNNTDKLTIPQGCHRFHYAILNDIEMLPVVVNAPDALFLKEKFQITIQAMAA
ncbi:hypothetical protein [Pseudoduganella aquatica]|uniref:Uncharacterized protein n=1 Tax=Pseudoduganella aquatica TaxID=2660641 RepID=A0A7X4HFH5_9BURK|nr:hypothetical protein [Pseudoduganella aquatica]MYN09833.1 hypothetical protein [Pseudoduganella aquatica]